MNPTFGGVGKCGDRDLGITIQFLNLAATSSLAIAGRVLVAQDSGRAVGITVCLGLIVGICLWQLRPLGVRKGFNFTFLH